jgi:hypothetical protein
MDFKKLTQRAKKAVEDRGGTDALKQDLEEIKGIAKGQGSVSEKAKAAAAALKHPGAEGHADAPATPAGQGPAKHGDPATGIPAKPADPNVHLSPTDAPEPTDAGLQPDPESPVEREPRNSA